MKVIFKAADITEAHIVSGLLNSRGIETHVGGYYLQGGVGDLAAMDFVNVQVDDENIERAGSVIAEYEGNKSDPGANGQVISSNFIPRVFASILVFSIFVITLMIIIEYS
jgi:hypothetical protein